MVAKTERVIICTNCGFEFTMNYTNSYRIDTWLSVAGYVTPCTHCDSVLLAQIADPEVLVLTWRDISLLPAVILNGLGAWLGRNKMNRIKLSVARNRQKLKRKEQKKNK